VLIFDALLLPISWLLCNKLVDAESVGEGALVGVTAFTLLMGAEVSMCWFVDKKTPVDFFRKQTSNAVDGFLGLGSQVLFALFPVMQAYLSDKGGKPD